METRTKYAQSGTGQVGYLYLDQATGKWAFDVFAGGPNPYQRAGEWDTQEQAQRALEAMEFTPAPE